MTSLPLKKSWKPVLQYCLSFLRKTYAWLLMFFLSRLLLQPHRFQVSASPASTVALYQEHIEQLIQSAKQNTSDGAIQYELLITLEGDDNVITYTVAPGDTLSAIAKLFGTTANAIREANNLDVGQIIRVGQKLKIGYDNSIIYDVMDTMTVAAFAGEYNINMEDLMTLNYFENGDDIIEEGQQIFVPLNRVEAEERGLITKKEFVMLDLPRKVIADDNVPLERTLSGSEQPNKNIPPQQVAVNDATVAEQVVITAEQSQQRLEELTQAKKEAEIAEARAKEAEQQAQEARQAAAIAAEQQKAEQARLAQIEAEAKAEQARLAQIEAEAKAGILAKAEAEEESARQAAAIAAEQQRLQQIATSCGEDACYHEGKCWTKPENAICAPTDPDNAWVCEQGFVDTGKSCITARDQEQRAAQATGPKQSLDVIDQWYFNPYEDGYGGNGWAGGHCTMYVGWWIWKNLGKQTEWRGNAKYWYDNAAAAGWSVGQTPRVGSVIVMKYGAQGWNGYGHVGIVKQINREARQVLIEDMNYVGRYVVSLHWVDMDSTANPVIGYIYP